MIWDMIATFFKIFIIIGGIIFNIYMFIHLGFFWVLVMLILEIKLIYGGSGKPKTKTHTRNTYRRY
jgi:hypothetical protein